MIRFEVHVHPGARAERVGGTYAGALVVRVRERAVDGAASDAVVRAVARAFEVPPASVTCLRGHRSRRKYLEVLGATGQLTGTHERLLGELSRP